MAPHRLGLAALLATCLAIPALAQPTPRLGKQTSSAGQSGCDDPAPVGHRLEEATPLRPGHALCIRLAPRQSAYLRIPDSVGPFFTISTRNLARGTDTVLALLDAQGRKLAENDDGGSGADSLASVLESGPDLPARLVRVSTLENAGGSFELLLVQDPPRAAPDFATSLAAAAARPPMGIGERLALNLRRGQSAYVQLPPARPGLVARTLDLAGSTDTVLTLLDANGATLDSDDDGGGGFASDLPLDNMPPGPLFLRASTLDDAGGRFTLALVEEAPPPPPDFPTDRAAARERGPLAPDAVLALTLRRRQQAFFQLPPGQPLTALTRQLQGETDTELALLDEDGEVLAEDDDGGGGFASRLATSRATGRAAFLRVSTLNGAGGRFELVLRPDGPAPGSGEGPASTIQEAARRPTLQLGQAVLLQLESGQAAIHALPFDGLPLLAMTFDLADGSDTVLELLDADGAVIDENDDAGGSLASRLAVPSLPRPAYLRVTGSGGGAATASLVVVRPAN